MDLTFVFPCLNEERFIAKCIQRVQASLNTDLSLSYEIVVADNGSTDRSREVAADFGARIINVPTRGYGAALKGGILGARGRHVMFADADGTYLYEDSLKLYQETVRAEADMGIASRLNGRIEPGAMPLLHRHLGTPALTLLINVFFKGRLSDCNSGFRCLKASSFGEWKVRSDGMEFASELLVKALKHGATTVEIPSGLTPPPLHRSPHLRTWRDGMRHLLFILSEKPRVFEVLGLALMAVTSVMQLLAWFTGPVNLAGLHVFDIHTKSMLLLGALAGSQIYLFGCMCYLKCADPPLMISKKLIGMDEGVLFFFSLIALGGMACLVLFMFSLWTASGFGGMHLVSPLLSGMHFLCLLLNMGLGVLGIHLIKRHAL